jgi:hypothetical protein
LDEAADSNLKLTVDYAPKISDLHGAWGEEHGHLIANCFDDQLEEKYPRG